MRNLRRVNCADTPQRCNRVQTIQLPALQGTLSAQEPSIRLYMKSAAPINHIKGLGADIYNLFSNLLASGILSLLSGASRTTNAESPWQYLKCRGQRAQHFTVHLNFDVLVFLYRARHNLCR